MTPSDVVPLRSLGLRQRNFSPFVFKEKAKKTREPTSKLIVISRRKSTINQCLTSLINLFLFFLWIRSGVCCFSREMRHVASEKKNCLTRMLAFLCVVRSTKVGRKKSVREKWNHKRDERKKSSSFLSKLPSRCKASPQKVLTEWMDFLWRASLLLHCLKRNEKKFPLCRESL